MVACHARRWSHSRSLGSHIDPIGTIHPFRSSPAFVSEVAAMVGPLPAWCLTHIASNRLPTLPPAGCWSTQRNHWIVPTTLVLLSGKGISPTSQELYTDSVLERSRAVILLCSLFFFTQFRLPLSVGSFLCSPIGWPPSITNEQKKTQSSQQQRCCCMYHGE